RPIRESSSHKAAPSLCVPRRKLGLALGLRLPLNAYRRGVRFVPLVSDRFFGFRSKRFFISLFWHLAMAPDLFVTALNANHPVRFPTIPGNFHSIGTHSPL